MTKYKKIKGENVEKYKNRIKREQKEFLAQKPKTRCTRVTFEFIVNGYVVKAVWTPEKSPDWNVHIFSFFGESFWTAQKPTRTRTLAIIDKNWRELMPKDYEQRMKNQSNQNKKGE